MDVLEQIHNKLPGLSKGQRKIANYILESYDQAAFQTAGALGKTVQVSESTVVRFAAELGYGGYPQMQKALQETVLNRLTSVQRMEMTSRKLEQQDILSTVLRGDLERLETGAEAVSPETFEAAVEALLHAKSIYIVAMRSAAALGVFFNYYLRLLFEDVRLLTPASEGELLEQLIRIGPRDTLFCISFPRYSAATVYGLQYGKSAGAKTVALTDCAAAPLAKLADVALITKSDMLSFVDSLVAPMSLLNALLVALGERRRDETAQTFDKLEEIWDLYHVYEKFGD